MSIKTQKRLLFIPIVNFIIPFCWLKRCFAHSITMSWFFKKAIMMVVGIMIVTLLRVGLSSLIDNATIDRILFFIDTYFCFLIFAKISLDAQIELENGKEH